MIAEKTSDDARRNQRMAAEIEEIVIRPHLGRDERFTEFRKDRCDGVVVVLTGSSGRKGRLLRCRRGVLRDDAGKIRPTFEMADETLQQEGRRMRRRLPAACQFEADIAGGCRTGGKRQAETGLQGGQGQVLKLEPMLRCGLNGCRKRVQREGGSSAFIVVSLLQTGQHGFFSPFGRLVARDSYPCRSLG